MRYVYLIAMFLNFVGLYVYMIENCNENQIQPCSIDLRLGSIFKLKSSGIVELDKNMPSAEKIALPYVLNPGEYVLASSIEKINQTNTCYGVLVLPRSRAFRIGLSIEAGLLYPGYVGEVIFGIRNISNAKIKLTEGMSIIQLCFFDIKSDVVPLKHTYQNGKII